MTFALELNIEEDRLADRRGLIAAWFERALAELAGDDWDELQRQGPLAAGSVRSSGIPVGPAGGVWGFVSVETGLGKAHRRRSKVLTSKNLAWLLKESEEPFGIAELGLSRLDSEGFPRISPIRISVDAPRFAPGWVRLHIALSGEDSPLGQEALDTAADFLKRSADQMDVSFGHIAEEYSSWETALEECLPGVSFWDTLVRTREIARGYSWVTILSGEAAQNVGGLEGLRNTGAFHDIDELACGGVWLRSTPRYDEFSGEAIEKVWRALAPTLPKGMPAPPSDALGGLDYPLVLRDAAEMV